MKVCINPSQLEIRDIRPYMGQELKAVCLSYGEAMTFQNVSAFEELLKKYGKEKQLCEGVHYEGYVAVFYEDLGRCEVGHIYGALKKDFQADPKGNIWGAFSRNCGGGIKYVWTFNDCRFADCIRETPTLAELIKGNVVEFADRLKEKLTTALLLCPQEAELTEEENVVLKAYHGDYYNRFFTVLD